MRWFQSFERKHYLHLYSDWIRCRWLLHHWRWRHIFPSKIQGHLIILRDVKTQKSNNCHGNLSTCNSLNIVWAHISVRLPTYVDNNILLIIFCVDIYEQELYRVSIKSLPDYKHLFQENYCTWNTNIIFLSKCNSKSFFTSH